MSVLDNFNPPALKGRDLPGLCKAQPVESIHISGVMDIEDGYDVFLFSTLDTLSKNNQTLPSAAILIPKLRQLGKQVAMFSSDPDIDRDNLIKNINYLGLSFSPLELIILDDFEDISLRYPLTPKHRILMVSTDLTDEIALGKSCNMTTLMVSQDNLEKVDKLGIWPHFISRDL